MKKLTQEDFIDSCNKIHNNKYNYSLVEYKNSRSKIKIICKEHGVFNQCAMNHNNQKQGCPKCVGRNQELSDFIDECNKIHKNKYSYELIKLDFIKDKHYIKIINKQNNLTYIQLAGNHKMGVEPILLDKECLLIRLKSIFNDKYTYVIDSNTIYSTSKIKIIDNYSNDTVLYSVYNLLRGKSPNKVTSNYFIKKCSEIHNNKYDYSLIKFNKCTDKVSIICPIHGVFTQLVSGHLNLKIGCPKCGGRTKYIKEELITKFNEIHFGKYDYSLINEVKCSNKINIICHRHGVFNQSISKHLGGQGCKFCNNKSIGEEYIKLFLERENILYIRQKGFDDCKYINKLNFDFYLPVLDILIEFDGIQHYKPVKYFGGDREYNNTIKRDFCKDKWCLENNKKLIRISYLDRNKINNILKNNL